MAAKPLTVDGGSGGSGGGGGGTTAAGDPPPTVRQDGADWGTLVPSGGGWSWYAGSLTTPPCAESVTRVVSTAVQAASPAQFRRLAGVLLDARVVLLTKRPVQPPHGQWLTCYGGA